MSASQISTASGVTLTATSTPDEQAEAAVKAVDSMKVSDIEGNQMKVTWDSVDENGNAKTYEGADALKQAASDIGENTIVSRTGGATTFAMGMANFLKSYLGGHDSMAFWYHFAIMFEALFILTTVDNGTRVARYQIGELLGNVRKLKKFADPTWKPGNIITTLIATACGVACCGSRVRYEWWYQRHDAYFRYFQPAACRRMLHVGHRLRGQAWL